MGVGSYLSPIVTMGLSVTVWPQFTSVTDRQTDDRLYDSNMQNILRMVAQKCRHDQTNGGISAASAI